MNLFKKIGLACLIGLVIACIGVFIAPGVFATSNVTVSGDIAVGNTLATAANINIPIGWYPKEVVVNRATPATGMVTVYWNSAMPSLSCIKTVGTTTAVMSMVTVSCISLYTGSTTTAPGFKIGPDSDLNSGSTDTLYWRALR
jgi:hypothetical protein